MISLTGVHPRLIAAFTTMQAGLRVLGFPIMAVQALRTLAEQQAAYAKGRTTLGPDVTPEHPLGRTVTENDGVIHPSNHQAQADGFGHAIDFAFLINGQPSWAPTLPWCLVGEAGKALGLRWGGDWHRGDLGHVELP